MAHDYGNKDEKNQIVYENSKDILLSVYQKCKEESVTGLRIPIELYEDRVLHYTEMPQSLLYEIANVKRTKSTLDLFERAIICACLSKMYRQLRSFRFNDIYEEVKDKVKNHELSTFIGDLRFLGYKHVNTLNIGPIVMEDPKFTFERFTYLNRIKKLRAYSLKTVYYLDERVIDLTRSFKKPWELTEDMSNIDGYVFFHIVSKHGFEKGLFCNQANAEDLIKWVSDIVLTFLKPSSVIVMDKSPLHGERTTGPITRYHSKEDMLEWLQRNNVPCAASMHKAQLYELIKRCPFRDIEFSLDLLFKSHGHDVLRLPQHYQDLSLTELLWEHVNTGPISGHCESLLELKKTVLETMKTIPPEKWTQFESTIEATEQEFLAIGEATDQALSAYQIDLKDFVY